MASVYRRKNRKKWYYSYKDEYGRQITRAGTTDRTSTQQIAARAETDASLRAAGIIDHRAADAARAQQQPLSKHLTDFVDSLTARHTTEHYQQITRARLKALMAAGRILHLRDLTAERVERAIHTLSQTDTHLGTPPNATTLNHHLGAVKEFAGWLVATGRLASHDLSRLKKQNPESDRRRVRRALAEDELSRLLTAAWNGDLHRRLTGEQRAIIYLLAMSTGFRAKEIRSLTRSSFDLEADPPTVTVEAAHSKHRRTDVQVIRRDVSDILAAWLETQPPHKLLFPLSNGSLSIQHDLAVAAIAYRDPEGRYADFHALRHTYITRLVASNVNMALVQSLARHSTPVLTINRYTDRRMLDRKTALAALPAPPKNTMAVRSDTDVAVPGKYSAGRAMPKIQSQAELNRKEKTARRTPQTA